MANPKLKDVTSDTLVLRADPRLLEVLHEVERGPLRFTDLAQRLHLAPSQVTRALKALVLGRLLEAKIEAGTYPNKIRYALTPAGQFELRQVRARLAALKSSPSPAHEREARRLQQVLS